MVSTLDCRRLAPNGGTVTVQDGALVAILLGCIHDAIPDRSVAGHYAQGQVLTTSTDDKRGMRFLHRFRLTVRLAQLVVAAFKGHHRLCPQPLDHLARFLQTSNTLCGRVQGNAIRTVLPLIPTGSNAELQSPLRDVVNG